MDDIEVMLKPEWVSWDSIKDCLVQAHEFNRKKEVYMHHPEMSSHELALYLKDAYCFVAISGDKVVGTAALKIINSNSWWAKGKIGYTCFDSIAQGYKGTDAYFDLRELRNKYIKDLGIRVLQFDTHINNQVVQKLNLKRGFKFVRFCAFSTTNYYSVVMVKWLEGCPFSDSYINFRFRLSKFLTKLVFKPGRKLRFSYW